MIKLPACIAALIASACEPGRASPAPSPSLAPATRLGSLQVRPARFTPGTYRVGGTKDHSEYPNVEILIHKSSRFLVELDFADNGGFTACAQAQGTSGHSRGKYASGGESHSENETNFFHGFAGTWRRDGDLAIAEITAVRNTCQPQAASYPGLLTLRCSGLVATGGQRLVQCTPSGEWARQLEGAVAFRISDAPAPWIVAGDQHGLAVSITTADNRAAIIDIQAATQPLSPPPASRGGKVPP